MSKRSDSIETFLRVLTPAAPERDIAEILGHAMFSKGLKTARPENSAWLSLVAYVRHTYTDYDDLLAEDYDIDSARHFCLGQINEVLAAWGCRRQISGEEDQ